MVRIRDNDITITQGDTLETKLTIITPDGETFEPSSGDALRIAIKGAYTDNIPILVKDIPIDTMLIRLESEETEIMKARRMPYVYDVQLTLPDGTVATVIAKGKLYVTEEVD